jgi:hypothetical protein
VEVRRRVDGPSSCASQPSIAREALPELLGTAPGPLVPDAEAHAAPRFDAFEHRLAQIETSERFGRAVAGEEISREVASICSEEQRGRVRHGQNVVREFVFEGLPHRGHLRGERLVLLGEEIQQPFEDRDRRPRRLDRLRNGSARIPVGRFGVNERRVLPRREVAVPAELWMVERTPGIAASAVTPTSTSDPAGCWSRGTSSSQWLDGSSP